MNNSELIVQNIINSFHEKNNSHAFLLETNNINKCYDDIIKIIKKVNCDNSGEDDCNICHTIDVGTNPDVIIIKPEKKEIGVGPVEYLMDRFTTQPSINKYSMYVVYDADLLSGPAANKILKFLEEPEEGIVGFFLTIRLSSILPTIKSRCELINIRYGGDSILDLLDITSEEYDQYYNLSKHIIDVLDNNKGYNRVLLTSEVKSKEREDILKIFKIIYKMYFIKFENIVNYEYNNVEYAQDIIESIKIDDINEITKRIKLLEDFLNDFKYNVNKELFINKLCIKWE